jgi:phage baseplate assembly protein W
MSVQTNLGRDLSIELLDARLLPVYRVTDDVARTTRDNRGLHIRDFVTIEGQENLGQALLMRLLTPLGELDPLGHPTYGARLYEIIGARNSDTTRNLAKLYVLAALAQERRVEKIVSVDVTKQPGRRDMIVIAVSILPIGADTVLTLSFSLELEAEV